MIRALSKGRAICRQHRSMLVIGCERQTILAIMPPVECRELYLDHIAEGGRDLFRVACERDLAGESVGTPQRAQSKTARQNDGRASGEPPDERERRAKNREQLTVPYSAAPRALGG